MSDTTTQLLKNGDIEYWTYSSSGGAHNLRSEEEVLANLDGYDSPTLGITLRSPEYKWSTSNRTGISIECGSMEPELYLEALDFIRGLHKLYQRWIDKKTIIDTKVPIASLPLRPCTRLSEIIDALAQNCHGAIGTFTGSLTGEQQFYIDWSCCDPAIVTSIDAFMHSIATDFLRS